MKKIKQNYALAGILASAAIGAMAVLNAANVVNIGSAGENGDVLPATTTRETVGTSTPDAIKTFDGLCMTQAVDQRETAFLAALDARNTAIRAAVQTRDEAQKAAWFEKNDTKRRTNLRSITTAYSREVSRVNSVWRTAKTAIWKKYVDTRKTCGPRAANEDSNASASLDSQI